jgi:hypothetical protein
MTVTFNGPLANPWLLNQSVIPSVQVWYTGVINAGQSVTLDCTNFTALDQANNSVIGNLGHAGSLHWMALEPGPNIMYLWNHANASVPVGAGNAQITFSPPYT